MPFQIQFKDSNESWIDLDDSTEAAHTVMVFVTSKKTGLSLQDAVQTLNRVAASVMDLTVMGWNEGELTSLGPVMRTCPSIHIKGLGPAFGQVADLSFAIGRVSLCYGFGIRQVWISPHNTEGVSLNACRNLVTLRANQGEAPLRITSLCVRSCPQLIDSLHGLPFLKTLDLSGDKFEEIQLPHLPTSLETLTLSTNALVLIDNLPSLRVFVATQCSHITSLCFGPDLPQLHSIRMQFLPHLLTVSFSSVMPSLQSLVVLSCDSLRSLTISGSSQMKSAEVSGCCNLEWLSLSGSTRNFTPGSSIITDLPVLNTLGCDTNPSLKSLSIIDLHNLTIASVTGCPDLDWLSISGSTCNSLISLDVSDNLLGDRGCRFEGRYKNLIHLSAQGNRLTKMPIHPQCATNMRMLHMGRNVFWRPVDLSHCRSVNWFIKRSQSWKSP